MPRITEARRQARRDEILRAAVRCVVRSGYQGATMADIIEESGLSAGAVYGYFASKAELLAAVADSQLGVLDEVMADALADGAVPDPVDILGRLTDHVRKRATGADGDLTVVIVQAWGEAIFGGPMRDLVGERVGKLLDGWTEVVRRRQSAGLIDPAARPADVGWVLHSMVPGYMLMRLNVRDLPPRRYLASVHALLDGPPGGPADHG